MRNKFPALIALFCILVYAGAVLFGAYRVYTGIQSQKSGALKELDGIQSYIVQNSSGFFTEPFRTRLQKLVTDCTSLEGIIITGPQVSLPFEKEPNFVIARDPKPVFISRFGYAALGTRRIVVSGLGNITVHSRFNAVNYEYLVHILRQSLFAILGALILSFLTMMITMLRSRSVSQDETVYEEYKTDGYNSFQDDEQEEDTADTYTGTYDDVFAGDFSASKNEEPEPKIDQELDDAFDLPDFDDFGQDNTTAASTDDDFHLDDFLDESDLTLPGYSSGTEDTASGPESPNGLYSPRSNIGWEAYTHDRLASELHRCASSEQDLTVLRTECGDGVNCDAKLYRKIADEAVGLFNLQDLSFEYGSRGITVIIPNAGLEQGISMAESFHARLFNTCYDSFHSKNDILTGISSRSGRLIEADRLLLEADKALEKAKIDSGSPIVAFKSDPEKYREYIKKET